MPAMKNMSVINGTFAVDFGDLDIIQEVITEDRDRICRLPGPPPPPGHLHPLPQTQNQTQNHSHLAMHSRHPSTSLPGTPSCPAPVLVARGTTSARASHAFPRPQPHPDSRGNMAPAQPSGAATQLGAARRGRGSSGSGTSRVQARPAPQQAQTDTSQLERILERPRLVVTEEPKERGMRFRYECEGRSAGSILGTSSTETKKTLPTIEIQGPIQHIKKVKVTVSLVTKDIPHRPHPHCLVGKDCAEGSGICVVSFNPHKDRRHSFANLGIQCIRRKELDASLEKRRSLNIDPFKTGNSKSIEDMDMNVVRLCLQCELEGEDGNTDSLNPVVSNPIYDKKATTTSELKINCLNEVKGSCTGKTEIYMLCDKVQKDDIEIIFKSGQWEAKGEFAQTDVHRQIAIVFKSPPYLEQDISEEVEVSVFLRRLSDHMESEPVTFTYLPHNSDPYGVTRKRKMKTDIGFSESVCVAGQNLAVSDPSSSSSSSSQSLEPFPFVQAEPRLFPEEVPPAAQPGPSSLGEIHYNLSPEDISDHEALLFFSRLLDSEPSLQAILTDPSLSSQLSSPLTGFPNTNSNFANMDVNFNLNPDGSGSGFGQQQDLSYYNDMRLQQMVNENQPVLLPLGVPDSAPLDMDQCDNDRCGLVQVKTEEDL